MAVIIIFWIIFGLITGTIAHSKNRNGFGWALIGFLLGIFGVIWIALMPKLEE